MTERMKTWIKGFAGGVAATVIVGGIGYFICFGYVPMIGEQGLSLSDLGKASKIAKLVDTYYLDYKEGDEDSQYTMEEGMYSGLVASLQDPYSGYYSKDAYCCRSPHRGRIQVWDLRCPRIRTAELSVWWIWQKAVRQSRQGFRKEIS